MTNQSEPAMLGKSGHNTESSAEGALLSGLIGVGVALFILFVLVMWFFHSANKDTYVTDNFALYMDCEVQIAKGERLWGTCLYSGEKHIGPFLYPNHPEKEVSHGS